MNKIQPPANYKLSEISKWAEEKAVSLPTVQRGFVWKPFQIENLWDSLLRGYPIGAFVLSPRQAQAVGESKFEMLDGQQRATAICLGFNNETFRDSHDKIKIFIDLEKPKNEDNRKYVFRVITKSHPWGYRRIDNTKTLDSDTIRKAMKFYEVEDHLEEKLDKFFPYDAILPVPFHFFTNAVKNNNVQELIAEIKEWPHYEKIIQRNTKERQNDLLECITEEKITRRIAEIFMSVKIMLDNENGQRVPALYLDFEMFKKSLDYSKSQDRDYDQADIDENNAITEASEELDNTTDEDEIENLFIRLNAGGTPLRGEELNYSVLKAHIKQEFQDKIEKCCEGIVKPSRFITIAYRLFQNQQKEQSRDAITMKIKPKQFQKTMSERPKNIYRPTDFEVFLGNVLDKKEYDNKTLLEYTRHLLEYHKKDNSYGLPYLIKSKIADNAPEVMFMLLYRLLIKKDRFDFNTDLHKKMLGMITLFVWLGKGEKQRDHAKLLSNIWPCVKTLKKELFWSSSTVQRALLNDILTPFPTYDKPRDKNRLININKDIARGNTNVKKKYHDATGFGRFIDKIFFNYELLLYAQREFLSDSDYFKEKQYELDDTNVPFDWDHISPRKYVSKKHGIPRIITDWYNSIGNLRAWPYSLNRIDQDNVPALKLNPLDRKNSSKDNNERYQEIQNKWKHYFNKKGKPDLTAKELKKELLKWSFCDTEWANCEIDNMKETGFITVYNLIMKRNLSICKEWYKELRIEEFFSRNDEFFSSVIDERKWNPHPEHDTELKAIFEEGRDGRVSKPIFINDTSLYFYFRYDKEAEEVLQDNNIEFGIYEKNKKGFISTLKISDKAKRDYDTNKKNTVQGNFTLVSFDEDSYVELFNNFKQWLKEFPDKDVKGLADTFVGSLVQHYQSRIMNVEQE